MSKVIFIIAFLNFANFGYGFINLWYKNVLLTPIIIPGRSKRSVNDSSECLKECLSIMRDKFRDKMSEQERRSNNGIMNVDVSMALDLPVFCPRVYKPAKACIDKCPFDSGNYVVSQGFGPLTYMCIDNYTEALLSWPCADRVLNAVKGECEKPCKNIISTPNTGGGTMRNNITATYTLNCKVSACELKCQIPKIKDQCQDKSVKFVQGLTKSGFDSAQRINTAITGKTNAPWPQECHGLQGYLTQ